jgi:hypothetical protein
MTACFGEKEKKVRRCRDGEGRGNEMSIGGTDERNWEGIWEKGGEEMKVQNMSKKRRKSTREMGKGKVTSR